MAVATAPELVALHDLRRARRRHRAADVDVFEALYRAYLTSILLAMAVLLLSGITGDQRLDKAGVDRAKRDGVPAGGLVGWGAVAIGLCSRGRAGRLVL